ncbi:MAG: CBS domain-containing protein [Candidatus Binatia bacterium]|nr:CBS domain-containing protein [Candidatus Binatia bacterium]
MKTVQELLQSKGNDIWSVSPEDSVFAALELMAEKGIGAVLVLEGSDVAGILSERDYARQVVLKGKASRDTPVREIMTTELFVVTPQKTVEECMALMTQRRVRHLPVLVGDRLDGLLSIGDIVKAVISEKQDQIEQLETYINQG